MRTLVSHHERVLPAPAEQVGHLLDTLGGPADQLWPTRVVTHAPRSAPSVAAHTATTAPSTTRCAHHPG